MLLRGALPQRDDKRHLRAEARGTMLYGHRGAHGPLLQHLGVRRHLRMSACRRKGVHAGPFQFFAPSR